MQTFWLCNCGHSKPLKQAPNSGEQGSGGFRGGRAGSGAALGDAVAVLKWQLTTVLHFGDAIASYKHAGILEMHHSFSSCKDDTKSVHSAEIM